MKENIVNIQNKIKNKSVKINVKGNEYELIFSVRAAKEVIQRYGGLENLGQKLTESGNLAEILTEVSWMITLLANQSVLAHNLKNPGNPKPLLTEEEFEILVTIADIGDYKELIFETLNIGMKREVESEEDGGKKKEQDAE